MLTSNVRVARTNKNLWKSLIVVCMVLVGCGTAIALEEHTSLNVESPAVDRGPVEANPMGTSNSPNSTAQDLSGSTPIAQAKVTDRANQTQSELNQDAQQASMVQSTESHPQSTDGAVHENLATSTASSQNVNPSSSKNPIISAPQVISPTQTKVPSEKKDAAADSPVVHSTSSYSLFSDDSTDHQDHGTHIPDSKDKAVKQKNDAKEDGRKRSY